MNKMKSEVAVEKFLSGYNCAQAVLYAYAPDLGLDAETALKLATGLGGGIGRYGETCGAVTGGVLALGLKFGRGERADRSAAELAHQKTGELMVAFEKVYGTCSCRKLLGGCDLRTSEGRERFKEQDLHHKVCVPCVRSVSEWLAGALEGASAVAVDAGN